MFQRLVVVLVLFLGFVGIWMGGCQTPEQKVEKLIRQLRDDGISVHEQSPALSAQLKQKRNAAILKLGKDIQISAVPALIQLLQDQKASIRRNAASTLGQIGPGSKRCGICPDKIITGSG